MLIITLLVLALGLMIVGALLQRQPKPEPKPVIFDQFTNWRGMRS